jgi:hypothetical protein
VYVAQDYSGPDGCLNIRREVVIKFSQNRLASRNEVAFYQWFREENYFSDCPKVIWEGIVLDGWRDVNALVMERMGNDLNFLRQKRVFTPRLTLAVAIQTVSAVKVNAFVTDCTYVLYPVTNLPETSQTWMVTFERETR